MFKGFKEFILRGNVIELAVAVVVGAAFNAVVDRLVEALINPLISAVFNAEALESAAVVTLPGGSQLMFGAVIAAILNFLIVAAVVYFVFVLPMNKMQKRNKVAEPEETVENEIELLSEIRDLLRTQNPSAPRSTPGHAAPETPQA